MDAKDFLKGKDLDNLNESDLISILNEYGDIRSKDSNLRVMAEFDNYKKRVQKEKDELIDSTTIKTLSSILEIDNDINIAIKNSPNNDGLKMIYSKLCTFLKNMNIEEIQTETYDSDLHEVIHVMTTGTEKIVEVISKGYMINGKPFRYPKIILSK